MEQRAEKYEELEKPVRINVIGKAPNISTCKRCQDVNRYENGHPQPTDAMQDERQHGTFSLVSQACEQADISIQAHLRLLGNMVVCKEVAF
jgi:hypothetical protein